jgi:hypothetical protein
VMLACKSTVARIGANNAWPGATRCADPLHAVDLPNAAGRRPDAMYAAMRGRLKRAMECEHQRSCGQRRRKQRVDLVEIPIRDEVDAASAHHRPSRSAIVTPRKPAFEIEQRFG